MAVRGKLGERAWQASDAAATAPFEQVASALERAAREHRKAAESAFNRGDASEGATHAAEAEHSTKRAKEARQQYAREGVQEVKVGVKARKLAALVEREKSSGARAPKAATDLPKVESMSSEQLAAERERLEGRHREQDGLTSEESRRLKEVDLAQSNTDERGEKKRGQPEASTMRARSLEKLAENERSPSMKDKLYKRRAESLDKLERVKLATLKPTSTGARGGVYFLTASGQKVYLKR